MKFRLRQYVGAAILAATVCTTMGVAAMKLGERPRTFEVGFLRGSHMAPEAATALRDAAAMLADHPAMHARVIGYTSPGQDVEADVTLSTARATAVATALNSSGVSTGRITLVDGRGGAVAPPHLPGETEAEWGHRASRVEITVER